MATQKLLHYFIDHEVVVITSYPLRDIVRNYDAAGRISKQALELMDHELKCPFGDSSHGIVVADDVSQ